MTVTKYGAMHEKCLCIDVQDAEGNEKKIFVVNKSCPESVLIYFKKISDKI